jgi:hypothetical protein
MGKRIEKILGDGQIAFSGSGLCVLTFAQNHRRGISGLFSGGGGKVAQLGAPDEGFAPGIRKCAECWAVI